VLASPERAVAIFVNYRRQDSQAITGRIDDHLRVEFGSEDVYRDVDSIPPGVDFSRHIENALERCDVCVAIIGPHWASDRLAEPADFVRLEIEAILSRGVPIIPVLVEGAPLPSKEHMPASLLPLLGRQSLRVDSSADFGFQFERLAASIRNIRLQGRVSTLSGFASFVGLHPTHPLRASILGGALCLVFLVGSGWWWSVRAHNVPAATASTAATVVPTTVETAMGSREVLPPTAGATGTGPSASPLPTAGAPSATVTIKRSAQKLPKQDSPKQDSPKQDSPKQDSPNIDSLIGTQK